MKLYTYRTFETRNYTTANWFFATSREKAEKLLEETVEKVKKAISVIDRCDALNEQLWKEYYDLIDSYGLLYPSNSIFKLKNPKGFKEFEEKRNILYNRVMDGYAYKKLSKISAYYREFYREEVLYESIEEMKKRIIEIDADKILPLVQTDGD